MYLETTGPQIITADTARQAPLGKPVLWVLSARWRWSASVCLRSGCSPGRSAEPLIVRYTVQRPPDFRRRQRHLQLHRRLAPAGARQRVDDGVDRRRRRADRAEFADAFGA